MASSSQVSPPTSCVIHYVYRNKFYVSFVSDIKVDDPETEKAATKIQAVFRGHRTRQNMKSGDVKEAVQDLNAEFNPNDEGSS